MIPTHDYRTNDHTVQFFYEDYCEVTNRVIVFDYCNSLTEFYNLMDRNDVNRNRILEEINRVSKWLKG